MRSLRCLRGSPNYEEESTPCLQDCLEVFSFKTLASNARCQPRPEAGAQRTLLGVGCKPLLGGFPLTQARASHAEGVGLPIALAVSNGAMTLAASDGGPGVAQECARPHDAHGRLIGWECARAVVRL
jgi:hypothetical protein